MKRLAVVVIALAFCLELMAPAAFAQSTDTTTKKKKPKNHGEYGVYFDMTHLQFASLFMRGVGGRVGFNINPNLAIEGDVIYDLPQSVTQTVTSGGVTTSTSANIRLIHGLFGPKVQSTHGAIRFFGVLKGGVLNFGLGGTNGNALDQLGAIKDGATRPVIYPGGGVEFRIGPAWLRVEAGDEIFLDNGANHNLKIMVGPQFRW